MERAAAASWLSELMVGTGSASYRASAQSLLGCAAAAADSGVASSEPAWVAEAEALLRGQRRGL